MSELNGPAAGPVPPHRVDGLTEISHTTAVLAAAVTLPDLLAGAFDAFEAIRLLARDGEAQHPSLLVPFMLVADAAVDGREALTSAPSLPAGSSRMTAITLSTGASGAAEITGAITSLADLLMRLLTPEAKGQAGLPDDRDACRAAAAAAQRISQLTGRGRGDGDLR